MIYPARKPDAFTLVEMLVVIGIASVLMSIGVGAYINMNKDLSWHSAVTTVTSLLDACRNSAMTDRTPTSLVFVTEPAGGDAAMFSCKEAYAVTMQRVGTWHFEGVTQGITKDGVTSPSVIEGAAGQTADCSELGDAPMVEGKYGHALQFNRWTIDEADVATEHKPAVTCQPMPAYDFREGVRISAWVRPEMPPAGIDRTDTTFFYPIVAKPSQAGEPVYALKLVLQRDEDLFRLVGSIRTDGDATSPPLYESPSAPMIRPGTWTHVAMLYSSNQPMGAVQIFVDDEPLTADGGLDPIVGGVPTGMIRRSGELLLIGFDNANSFHGAIDEVTFDAITTSDRKALPANVLIGLHNFQGGGNSISFDRTGKLVKATTNGGLPLITLTSSGSKMATLVRIEYSGAIKTWDTSTTMGLLDAEINKWE